ncbi:MAG: sugar-binding transcriptional regulator [Anaerolineales bacterium]|nr:sugar-binding transcriptional regulator [Anaerolineales bacterium]
MSTEDQLDLMTIASWLYYEEGLNQEEISQELSMNRVGVTRLLQKARNLGIIKFTITRPLPRDYETAREIEKRFGIKRAIVVPAHPDEEQTMDAIGKAGAQFLEHSLFNGCKLGMAWSHTVSKIADHLNLITPGRSIEIVELAGTTLVSGVVYNITCRIAEMLSAPLNGMPVPVVVSNTEAREAILKEVNISAALRAAASADIALVGIGSMMEAGSIVQTGFMTEDEKADLSSRGIVGEILMRFFDQDGRHVVTNLDDRVIGIQWEEMQGIPLIVGMVTGSTKLPAIIGSLRGKIIRVLITDSRTAEEILREDSAG